MKKWAIGIDLGGTKIEVALVSPDGLVHNRLRTPTDSKDGYTAVVDKIAHILQQLKDQNPGIIPVTIGIGVAGQIDKNTGEVESAPNLKWSHKDLQKAVEKKMNIPVTICNDVRAATWGEWLYGAGKDCDNMVCIFIGTGIGSGIVSGGKMLEGYNNTAGEIGHITIDMNGPECHCGNKGCFEALAGGWAIARDARAAVVKDKNAGKLLLSLSGGDIEKISGKEIVQAALENDVLGKNLIDKLAAFLIAGSVSVVNALGPQRLIFGGGIIEGMPELISVIRQGVKKRALPKAAASIDIMPAMLHNDSGVVGAAAYALLMLEKK
jgi:glucokinase